MRLARRARRRRRAAGRSRTSATTGTPWPRSPRRRLDLGSDVEGVRRRTAPGAVGRRRSQPRPDPSRRRRSPSGDPHRHAVMRQPPRSLLLRAASSRPALVGRGTSWISEDTVAGHGGHATDAQVRQQSSTWVRCSRVRPGRDAPTRGAAPASGRSRPDRRARPSPAQRTHPADVMTLSHQETHRGIQWRRRCRRGRSPGPPIPPSSAASGPARRRPDRGSTDRSDACRESPRARRRSRTASAGAHHHRADPRSRKPARRRSRCRCPSRAEVRSMLLDRADRHDDHGTLRHLEARGPSQHGRSCRGRPCLERKRIRRTTRACHRRGVQRGPRGGTEERSGRRG